MTADPAYRPVRRQPGVWERFPAAAVPAPNGQLPPRNLGVEQKATFVHRHWTGFGQTGIIIDHG
ncbi:hypothetical protein ACWDWU_41720 [Streptomyces sp. NPDC003442]